MFKDKLKKHQKTSKTMFSYFTSYEFLHLKQELQNED